MALSSLIEFDVQTGGHIDNGGGFKAGASGTDRSQSTSPHVTFDGSTIAASNGGTSATITLAGYTVINGDVGNVVKITGGTNFTTGYYEIVSVNTGANTWTLDRNCTSGAGSGMTGRMGGCSDHPNTIESILVDGNVMWIKSGTYQKVGANTYVFRMTQDGATASPVRIMGYTSTHGDTCDGTDRPLIDGNSSATNCLTNNSVNSYGTIFHNLRFANATGVGVIINYGQFHNCKISNNGGKGFDGASFFATLCEINNNTGDGVYTNDAFVSFGMSYCYVHDNGASGIYNANGSSGQMMMTFVISESNAGQGFYSTVTETNTYVNCMAVNNTGGSSDGFGIDGGGGFKENIAINCISKDNGRAGWSHWQENACQMMRLLACCTHGNGSTAYRNWSTIHVFNSITSDPLFCDLAGARFELQWGSPCLGAGANSLLTKIGLAANMAGNIGVDQNKNFFTWGIGTISKDTGDARSGSCIKFDPTSTTKELGYRFLVPCTNAVAFTVKIYVKKSSAGANCTLTFSASGAGITPVANDSITLTDSYVQYTSPSMTPNADGFVECILRATDGSTTGNIFVDDISIV